MLAKLIHQDSDIEEEVRLGIGEVELIAFAEVCPFSITVGEIYEVELVAVCLDDSAIEVTPTATDAEGIEHLGGYCYRLHGRLVGETLNCLGLSVDIADCMDAPLPDGSFVTVTADRMGVSFTSKQRPK